MIKLGVGHRYRFDYDRCTGCGACYEQCPVHAIEMVPERRLMRATIDGNEAAASVAYRLNEVCCIYPITPSSPMAELADEWSSQRRPNVWGTVPAVVEMQSEGGAAGALHGALQGGALATTFTASQGLLLMIPNMYKIAGELTSAVLHVAARSLAAQGLSIFGDHSDVMAVRQTGFALLASASVQEAHDLALVAQAATLRDPGAVRALLRRVPHLARAEHDRACSPTTTCARWCPRSCVRAHRDRALSPERPFIRGTAQNPDVYFQARETVNPFYARVPDVVEDAWTRLAERTGRRYRLVDYSGHPEAERVLVLMGSGGETARETVALLQRAGRAGRRRAGAAVPAVPGAGAGRRAARDASRRVAVLDRTKEPGSIGEPLFLDVVAALTEAHADGERALMPRVIGGRYGLSSKEFTPAMVAGVFDELAARAAAAPVHDRHQRRRLRHEPAVRRRRSTSSRRTPCARSSSAWARTARSARTRTRSRSSARRRACTRRATSSTTRRSPARRPCRTCASGRSRSARPYLVPRGELRRLPPVRAARAGRRARPGGARRDAAAQLPRTRRIEVWDALSATGPGADPRQAHRRST